MLIGAMPYPCYIVLPEKMRNGNCVACPKDLFQPKTFNLSTRALI